MRQWGTNLGKSTPNGVTGASLVFLPPRPACLSVSVGSRDRRKRVLERRLTYHEWWHQAETEDAQENERVR